MRSILTLLSIALAAPAFAGGVAVPEQPPVLIEPPAGTDWSGFYMGAIALHGAGAPTGVADISGQQYGLVLGFREDVGTLVVGLEFELTNGDISNAGAPLRHLSRMMNVGLEVGYDAGTFLPYATVGLGTGRFAEPTILPNFDATGSGYFFGVGVDYALTDEVTVGAEITQHHFTDFPLPNTDLDLNTLSLSASFRF